MAYRAIPARRTRSASTGQFNLEMDNSERPPPRRSYPRPLKRRRSPKVVPQRLPDEILIHIVEAVENPHPYCPIALAPDDPKTKLLYACLFVNKLLRKYALQMLMKHCIYLDSLTRAKQFLMRTEAWRPNIFRVDFGDYCKATGRFKYLDCVTSMYIGFPAHEGPLLEQEDPDYRFYDKRRVAIMDTCLSIVDKNLKRLAMNTYIHSGTRETDDFGTLFGIDACSSLEEYVGLQEFWGHDSTRSLFNMFSGSSFKSLRKLAFCQSGSRGVSYAVEEVLSKLDNLEVLTFTVSNRGDVGLEIYEPMPKVIPKHRLGSRVKVNIIVDCDVKRIKGDSPYSASRRFVVGAPSPTLGSDGSQLNLASGVKKLAYEANHDCFLSRYQDLCTPEERKAYAAEDKTVGILGRTAPRHEVSLALSGRLWKIGYKIPPGFELHYKDPDAMDIDDVD